MNVLENLKYSRSHEWVEEVDDSENTNVSLQPEKND